MFADASAADVPGGHPRVGAGLTALTESYRRGRGLALMPAAVRRDRTTGSPAPWRTNGGAAITADIAESRERAPATGRHASGVLTRTPVICANSTTPVPGTRRRPLASVQPSVYTCRPDLFKLAGADHSSVSQAIRHHPVIRVVVVPSSRCRTCDQRTPRRQGSPTLAGADRMAGPSTPRSG